MLVFFCTGPIFRSFENVPGLIFHIFVSFCKYEAKQELYIYNNYIFSTLTKVVYLYSEFIKLYTFSCIEL